MAIWAEIKKAINDDFSKPLNKLIESVAQEIINNIETNSLLSPTSIEKFNVQILKSSPGTASSPKTVADFSGKGKIYLSLDAYHNGNYKQILTIDGVSKTFDAFDLCGGSLSSSRYAMYEFEFRESFKMQVYCTTSSPDTGWETSGLVLFK
jgi:hypothetical protein